MTTNHIPSNFTLEEIVKYKMPVELATLVETTLQPFLGRVTEVEAELQKAYRDYELRKEQDYFKYNLLEEIQELCKEPGSKRDLIKAIDLAFDNSYVEM